MNINEIVKKFKERLSMLFDRDTEPSPKPYRDWMVAVFLFLFITAFFVSVGFFIFVEINKGEIFVVEKKIELPETIDTEKLQSIVETNEAKQKALDALLLKRSAIVDP